MTGTFSSRAAAATAFKKTNSAMLKWPTAIPLLWESLRDCFSARMPEPLFRGRLCLGNPDDQQIVRDRCCDSMTAICVDSGDRGLAGAIPYGLANEADWSINDHRPRHDATRAEQGARSASPPTPVEVYHQKRTIQLPRWQTWPAAQAKLEEMLAA